MARGKKKGGGKKKGSASASAAKSEPAAPESKLDLEALRGNAQALNDEQIRVATVRAVTGVLASEPEARDIKFDSFSLSVGGNQLVTDCRLELNQGCRYGLVGTNGCGKSNVLSSLAQQDLPMPEFMDLYHLHEECPASEMTGIEAVINHIVEEASRLEAMSESIIEDSGPDDERLEAIFERLDELDPTGSEPRARLIMSGLGFSDSIVPMDRKTKHMSGGWRMRVSLAKALFAAPSILLLDEPTNHLDLEACVWLEEHLSTYQKCLLVVSHSEDFLNTVCNNIIYMKPNPHNNAGYGPGVNGHTLAYYNGNYDTFNQVLGEQERVSARLYEKQQADMAKLDRFVTKNKANGAANSAKSKKKVLDKINENSVAQPQIREPTLDFSFLCTERLPPPVMPFDDVSFSYSGNPEDYL
jgi:ATP-binding cassette subfamily F protein 2